MKSALRATVCQEVQPRKRVYKRYQPLLLSPQLSGRETVSRDVSKAESCRIRINISGLLFETYDTTLARFPDTLLGCPAKRKKYFDAIRQEYFFNRNRNAFDAILFFYQSHGLLVRPDTVTLRDFCKEMEFFEMGDGVLKEYMKDEGIIMDDINMNKLPTNPVLRRLWLWLEYPNSSDTAKFVACWSVMFIFISIFVICAETLPKGPEGGTLTSEATFALYSSLEVACVIWFTFEFLARLISCPQKMKFMMDFMNHIDLAAIMPYYINAALGSSLSYIGLINAIRLLRVFRVFKLARHLQELKIVGRTIYATWRELSMILFFILISMVIFSCLTYYAEFEAQKDVFSSIPDSAWFVIVTLTNVGYGDAIPITVAGKLIGTLCALVGVLAIALPSPVISTRFKEFYDAEKLRKKELQQRQ